MQQQPHFLATAAYRSPLDATNLFGSSLLNEAKAVAVGNSNIPRFPSTPFTLHHQ
jgi:hypothetical protein